MVDDGDGETGMWSHSESFLHDCLGPQRGEGLMRSGFHDGRWGWGWERSRGASVCQCWDLVRAGLCDGLG